MVKPSINRVIKILVEADVVFLSAFGFISPIFAVFITDQIKSGNVEVVGFAAAIYWISKSLLQVPISRFLDKKRGEKDDLYCLIAGCLLAALVPFGYIFSSLPWHIYVLQIIYSIGMAMYLPSWCAIFTRHIDKGEEAFEWSLNSSSVGIGSGIAGAVGGVLANQFGFNLLFVIVGILALLGGIYPLLIYKDILPRGDHYLRIIKKRL